MISPWVDLGYSHGELEGSHATCADSDYVQIYSDPVMIWIRKHYCNVVGYPEAALTNRYISPASLDPDMEHVSFKGFPRTLIMYGDAEMLHDQIVTLRDKMAEDIGVDWVDHHVVQDGVHNTLILPFFEPQCSDAYAAIAEWLGRVIAEGTMDW